MRSSLHFLFCALLSVVSIGQAHASKPLSIVVPFPPGGAVDRLARVLAQEMNEKQGKTVIVENRPGAGSQVAMNAVKMGKADGTTLFLGDVGAFSLNRHMYSKLNYDVDRDLQPISLLAKAPLFLLVSGASPINSVQDLVKIGKSRDIAYGSPGIGTGAHIAVEMFRSQTGVKTRHIPYRGAAPALIDLVSGEVDFVFDVLIGSKAFLQDGRVRAIAAATPTRSSLLPNVPTIAESGTENVNLLIWWGVAAKAGTPGKVIDELQKDIASAMASKSVIKQFADMGIEIETSTGAAFGELINKDAQTYGPVIKELNIKLD